MDTCHKRAFLVARWAGAFLLVGEGNLINASQIFFAKAQQWMSTSLHGAIR
jgi:hypothetical protein